MNKTAKPVENGGLDEKILDLLEPHYENIGFTREHAKTSVTFRKFQELIAQEKAKWVSQMEQVIGEDDEVPPRPTGKEYLTRSQRTAVSKNVLRAKQRKALAKLLDKENTK